jgi:hypothetical protein
MWTWLKTPDHQFLKANFMEAIATQEIATPKSTTSKKRGTAFSNKGAIPLEERTDLTIAEVEALGVTEPYELIAGMEFGSEKIFCGNKRF